MWLRNQIRVAVAAFGACAVSAAACAQAGAAPAPMYSADQALEWHVSGITGCLQTIPPQRRETCAAFDIDPRLCDPDISDSSDCILAHRQIWDAVAAAQLERLRALAAEGRTAAPQPRVGEDALTRLADAQSAWSAYAEADCGAVGALWGPGSGASRAAGWCRVAKAQARALELSALFDEAAYFPTGKCQEIACSEAPAPDPER